MMKKIFCLFFILAALAGCQSSRQTGNPSWEVYFSPNGGATDAVVRELNRATSTVLVQAYSFTSVPIAKALTDDVKRGVNVRVILDKSNESEHYSAVTFLVHAGIPTYIDPAHAIAHNKVMIIDGQTVITGSFNFTKAAETRNAENLLVIHDQRLAKLYTKNWNAHLAHSIPMSGTLPVNNRYRGVSLSTQRQMGGGRHHQQHRD